jgi:alpha-L-arabinofuranosidase
MFGFVLFSSFLNAQSSSETEIVIDVKQKSTKISPFIYGQFIENPGRCINGGIYDEKSQS